MIRERLKKIDRFIFGYFYNQYLRALEKEMVGCKTLLDLGCGTDSPIGKIKNEFSYTLGIDIFEESLKKSQKKNIHDSYTKMDVLSLSKTFKKKSFDCVLASDLIEHLTKAQGLRLLKMMETIAKKKVIVFTPNGYIPQHEYNGNLYQVHRSGWDCNEMKSFGYQVTGINGWKALFGVVDKRAEIVWQPILFWGKMSLLSQIITQRFAKQAFQILCTKELTLS